MVQRQIMIRELIRYFALAAVGAALLSGQPKLPDGAAILDRYVDVTGGKSAYEKIQTESDKAVFVSDHGPLFTVTSYSARGKKRIVTETPGGRTEQGVNGPIVWELSSVTGVRIKQGAEKQHMLARARSVGDLDWRETYNKTETKGEEEINGKSCYRVLLTMLDGSEETRYYEKVTGLLVRAIVSEISDAGEVSVQMDIDDYQTVQGIKTPSLVRLRIAGQDLPAKIEGVSFNSAAHAKAFDLPREVEEAIKHTREGAGLPNGAALFERYIAATGGKRYREVETQMFTADLAFESAGLTAKMVVYQGQKGKRYQSIELEGMGKMESGSDGTIAWERSVTLGPRIVPRQEAKQGLIAPDPEFALNWSDAFSKVETVAEDHVDDKGCYRVRMVPKDNGAPTSVCFDKSTGYMLDLRMSVRTPMGDIPMVLFMRDYRDAGPIKMPYQMQTKLSGQPVSVQVRDIKFNAELPPNVFELPEDVRALVVKKAAEGKEKQ